ncbi:MAG TPA: glycosyltransferase family 4 protein [Planctomycetota bacterium]|nr:glycosyltransferase family 4 protein [Planctomycetota bacterium]
MSTTVFRVGNGRDARPGGADLPAVKKVLFVAGGLCDDSICHSVLRLARELKRRGCEVTLVCGGGPLAPELARASIPTVVLSRLATSRHPLFVPRALLDQVRTLQPDVLHFFGRSLARLAARVADATGKPYVLTVTTFAPPGSAGRIPGKWKRGAVMAVSEELREELVNQARIPKDAIGVIPIGIALEDYERYRATNERPSIPIVGTVGPLTPERGGEYFLLAAKEILDQGHDVQFLIAGDGPERFPLRRQIHKLGIDKWVTVAEAFSDYRRMIAILDICVIPAVREGLGLDVLEAMACRKPVVATGAGPAFSLISDGETGLLAPKKDPAAIAEKVIRLLREPELASRLVEAAYAMVRERFSVEATAEALLVFYARRIQRAEAS